MAKPLQERLASARNSDRTTIETLAKLVEDARSERERLIGAHEQASAESIDFALSENDREEAAANAARYTRNLAALANAIEELEAKLEAKRNSDAQRVKAAEKRAALTERDEISARFAGRVPAIAAELIELFKAVQANEQRLRAAGVHEANAEWHARGIRATGFVGTIQASSFRHMKIPNFNDIGRAWPVDRIGPMVASAEAMTEENHRNALIAREAAAKRRAEEKEERRRTHGQYALGSPVVGRALLLPVELVVGPVPHSILYGHERTVYIPHELAERLAKVPNLQVTRLDGDEE